MNIPADLKYTREHEWVRVDGDVAIIGITHHAQEALGDIVFMELPDIGDTYAQGDVFGVVESVKTTSDLYMPLAGTVAEINEGLLKDPAVVNQDCYEAGWMVKLKIKDSAELGALLSDTQYAQLLADSDNG